MNSAIYKKNYHSEFIPRMQVWFSIQKQCNSIYQKPKKEIIKSYQLLQKKFLTTSLKKWNWKSNCSEDNIDFTEYRLGEYIWRSNIQQRIIA